MACRTPDEIAVEDLLRNLNPPFCSLPKGDAPPETDFCLLTNPGGTDWVDPLLAIPLLLPSGLWAFFGPPPPSSPSLWLERVPGSLSLLHPQVLIFLAPFTDHVRPFLVLTFLNTSFCFRVNVLRGQLVLLLVAPTSFGSHEPDPDDIGRGSLMSLSPADAPIIIPFHFLLLSSSSFANALHSFSCVPPCVSLGWARNCSCDLAFTTARLVGACTPNSFPAKPGLSTAPSSASVSPASSALLLAASPLRDHPSDHPSSSSSREPPSST